MREPPRKHGKKAPRPQRPSRIGAQRRYWSARYASSNTALTARNPPPGQQAFSRSAIYDTANPNTPTVKNRHNPQHNDQTANKELNPPPPQPSPYSYIPIYHPLRKPTTKHRRTRTSHHSSTPAPRLGQQSSPSTQFYHHRQQEQPTNTGPYP